MGNRPLFTCCRVAGAFLAVAALTIGSYRSVAAAPHRPQTVSDFTLSDVNGKPVKFSSLSAKAVVVDIWATWCPPCEAEVPHLMALQKKYQSQGLQVVGIALDDVPLVQAFIQKNSLNYPVWMGSPTVEKVFGHIAEMPTTFVLDGRGHIRHVYEGYYGDKTTAALESDVQAVLGGASQ
ncbi:MAG TPA: TlpA disulfide reductase family protein [Candidatus Xenobia bacterium]